MKILAVIGLCAMLATLTTPTFATPVYHPKEDNDNLASYCMKHASNCNISNTGDEWNHQSSLSSTSEGGIFSYSCKKSGEDACDDRDHRHRGNW
jgi:hypothetical protein